MSSEINPSRWRTRALGLLDRKLSAGSLPRLIGYTNTTSGTIAVPAGSRVGDLIIVLVRTRNGTVTTPAGWTLVYSADCYSSEMLYHFQRVATASEPASYVFSFSGNFGACLMVWRNIHTVKHSNKFARSTSTPPAIIGIKNGLILGFSTGTDTACPTKLSGLTTVCRQTSGNTTFCVGYKAVTITDTYGEFTSDIDMAYDGSYSVFYKHKLSTILQ